MNVFIQMSEGENQIVRYFACGLNYSIGFTGIVHGYVGSGEYQTTYWFHGKEVEEIEGIDHEDSFKELTSDSFVDQCFDKLDQFILYDFDLQCYIGSPINVIDGVFTTFPLSFTPPDYGLTSWSENNNNPKDEFDTRDIGNAVIRSLRTFKIGQLTLLKVSSLMYELDSVLSRHINLEHVLNEGQINFLELGDVILTACLSEVNLSEKIVYFDIVDLREPPSPDVSIGYHFETGTIGEVSCREDSNA